MLEVNQESLAAKVEKAYDDLVVAVEASDGVLSLLLAVCDDPHLKDEIIQRYESELQPNLATYKIVLSRKEPSLREAIAEAVKNNEQRRVVITILGAEHLSQKKLGEERSEQDIFLGYLQWTRESLREYPFPVILWLTSSLLKDLSRKAPDFWSWRKDVFRFQSALRARDPFFETNLPAPTYINYTLLNIPNNLPFSGTSRFIGRDLELRILHQNLQNSDDIIINAIVGMGGIGKTELALQYAFQQLNNEAFLGGICWINARQSIGQQILYFAKIHLEIDPPEHLSLISKVKWCWKAWNRETGHFGNMLVIFDDVLDYSDIQHLLPPIPSKFKVLLTTRLLLDSSINQLNLAVLSEEESLAFLQSIVYDNRIKNQLSYAKELCTWLGYLPLSIELVGRYLTRYSDLSLKDLLFKLQKQKLDSTALNRPEAGMTATLNIRATFQLSWQDLSPFAQQLARVLTLFAPVDILWELVVVVAQTYERLYPLATQLPTLNTSQNQTKGQQVLHWLPQQRPKWLGRQPSNSLQSYDYHPIDNLIEARETLLRFNLLQHVNVDEQNNKQSNVPDDFQDDTCIHQRSKAGPTYRLHPLLKEFFEVQWEDADPEGWRLAFALAMGEQASRLPKQLSWEDTTAYHDIQPHFSIAEEILTDIVKTTDDADTRRRYRDQVNTISSAAHFRSTKPAVVESTLARARKTYSEAKAMAQEDNHVLASQKFAQALEDYRRAIDQSRQAFPRDSLQLAGYLNQIALIFRELGKYQEGIDPATEAVSIAADRGSPMRLARYLNDLGLLHYYQGNYRDAEPLYVRSLSISQTHRGENHPSVAISLNNLAQLYQSQGRYSEAEPLLMRSLSIREAQLGEDYPSVATSLNNLAELYQSQGRYSEAEPLYVRSLSIMETHLGEDHPNVATSLNNLAQLYKSQGRYSEAEPLYVRSLSIWETQLGEDHPDVATSLNNLAGLYKSQGRYSQAELLLGRSLSILDTQLGEDHPDVATSLNNLAQLYQSQGRYSEAEPQYLRALAIWQKTLSENHPYIKTGRDNFVGLVKATLDAGQEEQLSDHLMTQEALRKLKEDKF